MLNKIPQELETLVFDSVNPAEIVESIYSYIDNSSCKNLSIDISFMNVMDACYVTTLCATKHFTKYPDGKINWKISSELIQEFNKDFELGNSRYSLS